MVDLDLVSEFLQIADDRALGLALVVAQNVRNVLQDKTAGLLHLEDLQDLEEQLTLAGVGESELVTRLRERLTRKTCSQDFMVGDLPCDLLVRIEVIDVRPGTQAVVVLVEDVQLGLPLGGEDGLSMESSSARWKPPRPANKSTNLKAALLSLTAGPALQSRLALRRVRSAGSEISLSGSTDNRWEPRHDHLTVVPRYLVKDATEAG